MPASSSVNGLLNVDDTKLNFPEFSSTSKHHRNFIGEQSRQRKLRWPNLKFKYSQWYDSFHKVFIMLVALCVKATKHSETPM